MRGGGRIDRDAFGVEADGNLGDLTPGSPRVDAAGCTDGEGRLVHRLSIPVHV